MNQAAPASVETNTQENTVTMVPVQSSNIIAIGYDEAGKNLFVTFKDGATYRHMEFPADLWEQFRTADSTGKWYHANIKGKYESEKGAGQKIAADPIVAGSGFTDEQKARIANTQYKIQLTLQVIGPLLATIPDDELKEYIMNRAAMGEMNEPAKFLHKFASRLDDINTLVNEQAASIANAPAQGTA